MNERDVLGVFAKCPRAGHVKSRLAQATSPQWAAQVAEAFLSDWLAKLKGFAMRCIVVYSPREAENYFANLASGSLEIEAQVDGDLGARMEHFLKRQFAAGKEKIVIIGTDSPTLPLDFLSRALTELDKADVVLGPAEDGGYYLLGCARRVPDIFAGIPWGESGVLRQTVARLKTTGTDFSLLPVWYDVDTFDDWQRLCGEVRTLRAAGIDPGIPSTERLMGEAR